MKFLHTSDWHLGISFRGADAAEDQRFFLAQLRDLIREKKIDAVLISGDIFDRSIASAEAVALYDRAVTQLCAELKTQVLIIAGNHDSAERLSQCSGLLDAAGLHVCGALTRPVRRIIIQDAEFFLLPWLTTEKVRALWPEAAEAVRTPEDAYRLVCGEMRRQFTPGKRHILLSHSFIVNAETSESDRAAEIGMASAVPSAVFEGFDYVALGHIHKAQDIGERIRYSGTPMPYSFGKEETQEKSVTAVDTADLSREILPFTLLHRRTTLRGSFEELLRADYPEEIRNGYTRLEVTDVHATLDTFAMLREKYAYPLEMTSLSYDREEAGTTVTLEELEGMAKDPQEVFRRYMTDIIGQEPTEHLKELFRSAAEAYEREAEEA